MAIGVEYRGKSYGLLIDAIGEVLKLPTSAREDNPVNLDPGLARVSAGVHRLDGKLLVVLDVDRVLDIAPRCRGGVRTGRPEDWSIGSPRKRSEGVDEDLFGC